MKEDQLESWNILSLESVKCWDDENILFQIWYRVFAVNLVVAFSAGLPQFSNFKITS